MVNHQYLIKLVVRTLQVIQERIVCHIEKKLKILMTVYIPLMVQNKILKKMIEYYYGKVIG